MAAVRPSVFVPKVPNCPGFHSYQRPTSLSTINSQPYASKPQERVCILLCKPKNCYDNDDNGSVCSCCCPDDNNDNDNDAAPVQASPNEDNNQNMIRFTLQNNMDNCESSATVVPWVVETNMKICQNLKGINGLPCHCPVCESLMITNKEDENELQLWKHIVDDLPLEIIMNVLQCMCYDQVSWLADKNVEFARRLAFHKYDISDSHDRCKYPDLAAVLRTLRRKNAEEMRFNGNEDLWICKISDNGSAGGVCHRYATEKGTYIWHKISSMMALNFDYSRCACPDCYILLDNLTNVMHINQQKTLLGMRTMVFALKHSELTRIDMETCSAYWKETAAPNNYSSYFVHMWTDDTDYGCLQNMQNYEGRSFTLTELMNFKTDTPRVQTHVQTLIFKNPVKFFTVPKIVEFIDNSIVAILSSVDHEVLGYIVNEKEYRVRLPNDGPRRVIGLNFVPNTVLVETICATKLTKHVYSHDIDYTIRGLKKQSEELKSRLASDLIDREALLQMLTRINNKLIKLQQQNEPELEQLMVHTENRGNEIIHVHVLYANFFDSCSKYIFEPLAVTKIYSKDSALLLGYFTYEGLCSFETCNLGIINKDMLLSLVSTKSTRCTVGGIL